MGQRAQHTVGVLDSAATRRFHTRSVGIGLQTDKAVIRRRLSPSTEFRELL